MPVPRPFPWILLAGLAACSGSVATGPARLASAPALVPVRPALADEPRFAELVARSVPSVVLLLNTQTDGAVKYGAGLLVDRGLVLTSQHVVADAKTLGAML